MNINNSDNKSFFALPMSAREWLGSVTATDIIVELNEKYTIFGEEIKIIPRLITQLIVGMVPPENFSKKLSVYLPFLSVDEVNYITKQIKSRILKPIAGTLKSPFGVDIRKIVELPPLAASGQAKITEIEQPFAKAPEPPKRIDDIAAPTSGPRARVTKFARPDNLGGQATPKSSVEIPINVKKKPDDPNARVSDPRKPLTLVEKVPE